MESQQAPRILVLALALLPLAACGGGNGGTIASAPTPIATPTPTPTPTTSAVPVKIFNDPAPQEYAVLGASTSSAGDGYEPVAENARLTQVSLEAADQPRIRYTSDGRYEVQLPGESFDQLVHYKGLLDPSADNNFFQPSRAAQNYATVIVSQSRLDGYQYSELATWTKSPNLSGYVAFGTPTPAASVPVIGQATFVGPAPGMVDVTYYDNLYGGYYFTGVDGQVRLNVDFGRSILDGLLSLKWDGSAIGDFAISPITFGSASNGFRGSLATGQSGYNDFRGLFTGPSAQEAIGSWAVPVTIQGQPHQAIGAWIARRGN